ncbi:MAG: hypothetical protein V4510_03035 [bacterium]
MVSGADGNFSHGSIRQNLTFRYDVWSDDGWDLAIAVADSSGNSSARAGLGLRVSCRLSETRLSTANFTRFDGHESVYRSGGPNDCPLRLGRSFPIPSQVANMSSQGRWYVASWLRVVTLPSLSSPKTLAEDRTQFNATFVGFGSIRQAFTAALAREAGNVTSLFVGGVSHQSDGSTELVILRGEFLYGPRS